MPKLPEQKTDGPDSSPQAGGALKASALREIDNIVFKNLFVNSLLAIIAGIVLFAVIRLQQQMNWWSLTLLAIALSLVAADDLISWIRWQLTAERCLKQEPVTGFWMQLNRRNHKLKADIGSSNYPERPIWRCDVFGFPDAYGLLSEQCRLETDASVQDNKPLRDPDQVVVRVYMHTDGPVPVAMETDEVLFLVKPPARISMILIEFLGHYLSNIFPRKHS